ncbi:MAG TPA: HAMP domain-containing histidine kinase [Tissierellia bacterium]|nr:HAMP domain-containing histidine kinase [Tissierellia bacterium]
MVENLLDFSRKKDQEFKEINLYETLNEIISFESKKISEKNIKVTINCNNIFFYIDLEIFTLVILNLLSNAIDVVSEGGEININCYLDDSYLYIDFADTGKGIEPEHIEQIFNPFFTTKATGKGTGLGLYIVYNQLQKINGEISVDSRVDEGTVFKLKFSKGGNYGF